MNDTGTSLKKEMLDIFAANGYTLKGYPIQSILQMLLLECMKDKNASAAMSDSLISRFGDINNILFADINHLCSAGLLPEEAEKLLMIGAVFSRISADSYPLPIDYTDHDMLKEYFNSLFRFETLEKLYVFPVIDNKIVDCCFISEGGESSMRFNFNHIVKLLSDYPECRSYILAHNHPEGRSKPSPSDIASTKILASKLKLLGYELIAHYIVGKDDMDIVLRDINYVEYLFGQELDD